VEQRPLILIVEDNENNLELVRDILEYNGYRTLEARSARDGVDQARSGRPDLILMDIQLPDADGVTALGELKAEATTADIPVVALTAFAMKEDRQRFAGAGFDGYLSKPIDIKTFPDQVKEFFVRARGEQ
jgi:two-component system, cell cycle response regulator DivK